jgi:hypothetical protein
MATDCAYRPRYQHDGQYLVSLPTAPDPNMVSADPIDRSMTPSTSHTPVNAGNVVSNTNKSADHITGQHQPHFSACLPH